MLAEFNFHTHLRKHVGQGTDDDSQGHKSLSGQISAFRALPSMGRDAPAAVAACVRMSQCDFPKPISAAFESTPGSSRRL